MSNDRNHKPGRYFARFYVVDPAEEGPDDEIVDELCFEDEVVSLDEAIARAQGVSREHPNAYAFEVVERQNLHWDCGWDWRGVVRYP
jgi:hypothetical protein